MFFYSKGESIIDVISAKEAAEKWGVHIRIIQRYCQEGRIPGAPKYGNNWLIPGVAKKPGDGHFCRDGAGDGGSQFTRDNITDILSLREFHIASLVARRVPYPKIVAPYGISVGRLKNIITDIYGKLLVSNRDELAQYVF